MQSTGHSSMQVLVEQVDAGQGNDVGHGGLLLLPDEGANARWIALRGAKQFRNVQAAETNSRRKEM
jgi:hypothetical protein